MVGTFPTHCGQLPLAGWTRNSRTTAGQDLMAAATHPEITSFALGLPAPELFPATLLGQAVDAVLGADSRSLQYGQPFLPLKIHVTNLMRQRGVICTEDQVFLTSGAQQGINLVLRLLVDRGSVVVCEDHTYFGFQQAMQSFDATIETVPSDIETGMDVDAVESMLKQGMRPRLIYTVPDGHNPLGVSLDIAKRKRLVELARYYGVPLLEDDAYGFLYYGAPTLPLRSLDEDWVIYIGTFSKLIAPAFRLGWLVAPPALMPNLSIAKAASDIDTSSLSQHIISKYLEIADFGAHLTWIRSEYNLRRDAMLNALSKYFPEFKRSTPRSGFYAWLELGEEVDTLKLLTSAIELARVAYVPGAEFRINRATNDRCHTLRLSFSVCTPMQIEQGVGKLKSVFERL